MRIDLSSISTNLTSSIFVPLRNFILPGFGVAGALTAQGLAGLPFDLDIPRVSALKSCKTALGLPSYRFFPQSEHVSSGIEDIRVTRNAGSIACSGVAYM